MIGDPELSIVEELIGIIEQSVIVIRLVLNQSIYGVQPAEVEQELRQDDPVRVLAARLTHVINHAKSSAEEDVTDNGDGADVTSEDTDSVISRAQDRRMKVRSSENSKKEAREKKRESDQRVKDHRAHLEGFKRDSRPLARMINRIFSRQNPTDADRWELWKELEDCRLRCLEVLDLVSVYRAPRRGTYYHRCGGFLLNMPWEWFMNRLTETIELETSAMYDTGWFIGPSRKIPRGIQEDIMTFAYLVEDSACKHGPTKDQKSAWIERWMDMVGEDVGLDWIEAMRDI